MQGIDIKQYRKKQNSGVKLPVSKETKSGWTDLLSKDISLFGAGLSDKKKEDFYQELGTLLGSGVDIKTSLELIANEQSKEVDKKLFTDIKDQILTGGNLSEAMKSSGKFSAYEYFSVEIGEETGKVTPVLKDLAIYFQKKIKQRRQLVSALTYPAIVLLTSVAAIIFMMNFIVPMFADVFKRFGGDLPFLTAFIVKISGVFRTYFWLVALFLTGIIVAVYQIRNTESFRKWSAVLLLKLPVLGEIIRKIYLARFCNSMNLLISSKIPMLRAISLTRQMIGFYPIEQSLVKIEDDIMHGQSLHKSMSDYKIYYSKMITLIKVGEEVNQLDVFFDKLAKQYSEEIEHQSSVISSLLEPFIIIFLGLIVGVILIAMYLPMFQLGGKF